MRNSNCRIDRICEKVNTASIEQQREDVPYKGKNLVANNFKYCRVWKGKEEEEEKNLWKLFGGEGEREVKWSTGE